MLNVVALDIETRDPAIKEDHGYLHPDFKILDCGASYFDKDGVLVSCHFDFINKIRGIDSLLAFLNEHKFDKLVFHNIRYDLPALIHFGFPFREFDYSDTMLYSTLLEPFRPSNSLGSLCEEYDIPTKKISDEELVFDIISEVIVEYDLTFTDFERVKYDEDSYFYLEALAKVISGKKITNLGGFYRKEFLKNKKSIESYVDQTYKIKLKKIKTCLSEVKSHFPKIYYEYLVTDTEATLLLYYKLVDEVNILCEDFDDTFTMEGRTLKDIIKTEEGIIKTVTLMSTTPLALDWNRVDKLTSEYEKNLAIVVGKFPIFFHESLEHRAQEHPDYKEAPEFAIDFILQQTRDTLTSLYPNMFARELEVIDYALNTCHKAKDKLTFAKQSFLFKKINSILEKDFKDITKHYLGDMDLAEKHLSKSGRLSLKDYTIKSIRNNEKVTPELLVMFDFIAEINRIDINYSKFLKPFTKYRDLKGNLYTQLYSYKTVSGGKEDDEKGTATGRLSSNHFNVQTLPKAENDTYGIRTLFLPRPYCFENKYSSVELAYVSVDWSSQEDRLHQVLSGCKKGLELYWENQNADPHLTRAAKLIAFQNKLDPSTPYKVIKLSGNSEEKSGVYYEGGETVVKVSSSDRSKAKSTVFGVAYKIGPARLAENLRCKEEEAYALLKNASEENPEYLEMYRRCIRAFSTKGYISNMFGRIYKPYRFKKLYRLSYFEKFFRLESALSFDEKNLIMEDRKNKLLKEYIPSIWGLASEEFHREIMSNVAEYRDITKLMPYENYVKIYEKAIKGIYDKDTLSNIVYIMHQKDLLYDDKDRNIRDIIAIHGKFVFKDSNWDYRKECLDLQGLKVESKYPYNPLVRKLRGEDLENWNGNEDIWQVRKFWGSWCWHICNHSIEYTYEFLKKIVNFECQSAGADMLKEALARMWEDGVSDPESPNFIVDLNFPVHDDINMTMVYNEDFEKNLNKIKSYMEFEFNGVKMLTEESIKATCQIN